MDQNFKIGQRIRVREPGSDIVPPEIGGGKTHFGRITDIVRDMFDGSDLYLVEVLGIVKTYKAASLLPLKRTNGKM